VEADKPPPTLFGTAGASAVADFQNFFVYLDLVLRWQKRKLAWDHLPRHPPSFTKEGLVGSLHRIFKNFAAPVARCIRRHFLLRDKQTPRRHDDERGDNEPGAFLCKILQIDLRWLMRLQDAALPDDKALERVKSRYPDTKSTIPHRRDPHPSQTPGAGNWGTGNRCPSGVPFGMLMRQQ